MAVAGVLQCVNPVGCYSCYVLRNHEDSKRHKHTRVQLCSFTQAFTCLAACRLLRFWGAPLWTSPSLGRCSLTCGSCGVFVVCSRLSRPIGHLWQDLPVGSEFHKPVGCSTHGFSGRGRILRDSFVPPWFNWLAGALSLTSLVHCVTLLEAQGMSTFGTTSQAGSPELFAWQRLTQLNWLPLLSLVASHRQAHRIGGEASRSPSWVETRAILSLVSTRAVGRAKCAFAYWEQLSISVELL